MRNKKGALLDEERIKLIVAVAVFAGMVYLIFALFAPGYDRGDALAESYFDMLDEAMNEVERKGSSSFFMIDDGDNDLDMYLVYMGEAKSLEVEIGKEWFVFDKDVNFLYFGKKKKNVLCVCSLRDKKGVCNYCEDFGVARLEEEEKDVWVVKEGKRVFIEKKGDGAYVFSTKEDAGSGDEGVLGVSAETQKFLEDERVAP